MMIEVPWAKMYIFLCHFAIFFAKNIIVGIIFPIKEVECQPLSSQVVVVNFPLCFPHCKFTSLREASKKLGSGHVE